MIFVLNERVYNVWVVAVLRKRMAYGGGPYFVWTPYCVELNRHDARLEAASLRRHNSNLKTKVYKEKICHESQKRVCK